MFFLKIFTTILDLLKKDQNPTQVGLGVAFGLVMAFQPMTLLWVIIFMIFFVIKVNKASGFLSLFLFKIIAVCAEPLVVQAGAFVLEGIPALRPLWAQLRSTPFIPLTKFYNTAVMGGLVVGIVLFFPSFLFGKWAYAFYKDNLKEKIPFLKKSKKDLEKEEKKKMKAQGAAGAIQ
ncbi:MAG: TIGR03546 family protein [Spirochaetes bacterium]|nr:TIGR03546 family protein [Spirochaetota bacterium]